MGYTTIGRGWTDADLKEMRERDKLDKIRKEQASEIRLFMRDGEWVASSAGGIGTGSTPEQALRCLRVGKE